MNQHILESIIKREGYTIADARVMRPNDLVEGVIALRRRGQRRVLTLERMTATEAAVRLSEARAEGWTPVRVIRSGPPKSITTPLGLRRATVG